jgi:hypothetical protein
VILGVKLLTSLANKYCHDCKTTKNTTEFFKNKLKKDGFDVYCKTCAKARAKNRRLLRRMRLDCILGAPCCDCGNYYDPECMQFHHIDPNEKEYNVSNLVVRKWHLVINEIRKCVIICSNCHATRHQKEREGIYGNS